LRCVISSSGSSTLFLSRGDIFEDQSGQIFSHYNERIRGKIGERIYKKICEKISENIEEKMGEKRFENKMNIAVIEYETLISEL
jgi:hypothetical protein